MRNLANAVQSQGRGNDTMLVHMTPREVGGLQALAMANGGSLTINPQTGLPEAGFLDNLLPTILGIAGTALFPMAAPWMIGAGVGGIEALRTGDLGKGLMAGLGAFGGANLGAALSGAGAANVAGNAGASALGTGTGAGASGVAGGAAGQAAQDQLIAQMAAENAAFGPGAGNLLTESLQYAGTNAPGVMQSGLASAAAANPAYASNIYAAYGAQNPSSSLMLEGVKGLGSKQGFSNLGTALGEQFGQMGTGEKIAAGLGAANTFGAFEQPAMQPLVTPEEESDYAGPYLPTKRTVTYPGADRRSTSEFSYFSPSNPIPYAEGGETDRSIKMPGAGYQGGVDPEFGHNFRPVEVATTTTKPSAPSSMGGKGGIFRNDESIVGYTGSGDPIYKFNPTGERGNFGSSYGSISGSTDEIIQRLIRGFGLGIPSSTDSSASISDRKYNPRTQSLELPELAAGGGVNMEDGGFVVDARTVSEIGNGSSNAGLERLASIGARPIQGRGDGVSDSIPANIGGSQAARVARDEAYLPPEAVKRAGGATKLYAMMDKAHKARKSAKRGENTGGLKALMA